MLRRNSGAGSQIKTRNRESGRLRLNADKSALSRKKRRNHHTFDYRLSLDAQAQPLSLLLGLI
jgi:hypothetical protein